MTHLSSERLERYLDADLPPQEHEMIAAHLSGCAACRSELAALKVLFADLAALPDDPPPIDLQPLVLARLAPPAWDARAWGVLLVQALLCLLIFFNLAPSLDGFGVDRSVFLADLPRMVAHIQPAWTNLSWEDVITVLHTWPWRPVFGFSVVEWGFLLGAAGVGWLLVHAYVLGGLRKPPLSESR
ncbi:MAG: hypothetical protein HC822_16010 [Oscillochloris sp.]|nr:hypothetical protein [Oscillochloris sp.]